MRMIAKITSFTLLLSMVTIASSDPVACRLVEVFVSCPHGDCPPEPNQGFRCIDDDGLDRDLVGLESDFFTKPWHYGRKPQSGDILHASSGGKRKGNNRNEFVVDSGSTVSVEEGRRPSRGNVFGNGNGNRNGNSLRSGTRRRDLAAEEEYPTQLTGDSSVLLVYVTADNGAAPTLSKERFFDEVFAADNFNLVSRYNACSNNQLRFAPAVNASDGVSGTEAVEVHLNQDIAGMGRRAVETLVDDYIIANHGWLDLVTGFDHLMYIFPSVVDFLGANAYALGFGGRKSVYNDQSGAYIGVQSHELGHNLGLRHSGEDGVVYGDRTCLMGQTFGTMANFESPRMCFNGAKSWYLGWYSAGHQEVTGGFEGQLQLVGIDDYNNGLFSASAGDRVVLKIPHISDNTLDLYVMYNRKKGVTDETQEYQNEVVIVQSPPDQAAESWSIAHLSAGESYSSRGHGYDGSALVLSVDSISEEAVGTKDFATVTISYDFSPTASPTSCPIDDDFRLEFKSDQFPVDTSWDIVDSNDVMVASATSYSKAFFISEEEYCLEGTPPYTFTFNDQHGDGLTAGNAANPADANGNVGYFRIFYAGSEVQTEMATLGQFNTYSISFGSAPSPTPSPVTPSPVTPSPVTPSPVTPSPVTQSPVTPSPVTPAPTPSPVTPSPVTPSPITPSPVTSSPVTPDPTPSPVTPSPVTPSPVTPEPTPSPVATPAPIVTPAPVTLRSVTKYFCQKSLASQDQCEDPGLSQSCGSDGIKGICSRGSKCRHLTCTTGGPDPTPSPVSSPTPSPVSSPTPSPVSNPTPSPVSNPTPSPVTVVTPNPVNTCAVKNGFCTRDSDCCSLDCNTGRRKCRR